MMQISINNAKTLVKAAVEHTMKALKNGEHPNHMPLYIHSSPGMGKSAIVRQIANDNDLGFVDLRLASLEASDVCGIPYVSHAGAADEAMKFSIPQWFPSKEKAEAGEIPEYGIVFFDELSNAPVAVQHAAYRIILDREVQTGVEMAPGWIIVAAGNLKSDKTGAKGVAPALANRFAAHLEIRPDLGDFTAYAVNAGIHHHVLGYLNFQANMLYNFDPTKNDVAFATPRSWEQASNILNIEGLNDANLGIMLEGCVGEGAAHGFMAFRKYYGKLPNFEKIMDGLEDYKVPKDDAGLLFAVTSSVIDCLVQNHDNKKRLGNLEKIMTQLPDDFLVMVYKTLKSGATEKAISAILVATMKTYGRISTYTKAED
jgi:hypothetical protein